MNDIKLKPCPFCLRDDMLQIHSDGGCQSWRIHCHNCGASKGSSTNDTEEGVIESWNTRVIIEK